MPSPTERWIFVIDWEKGFVASIISHCNLTTQPFVIFLVVKVELLQSCSFGELTDLSASRSLGFVINFKDWFCLTY